MKAQRPYPQITITPKGEAALVGGHPWVYEGEVTGLSGPVSDGQLVDVISRRGSWLGCGFFNSRSRIRVRVLSRNPNDRFDRAFWRRRIQYAWDYRKTVMGPEDSRCCRMIFGEADGFPGLTVDRFESVLVAQVLCLGMELIKEELFSLLLEVLRSDGQDVVGVYERNDVAIRGLEGMEQGKGWHPVDGEKAPDFTAVDIVENGIRYTVDFENGQKTGFFLDQKYNRQAVAKLARGRTVLDCFTHTGSFALNAARGGAKHVTAVDVSEFAVECARENARRNGLSDRIRYTEADAFDYLRALGERGRRACPFDFIILDCPPSLGLLTLNALCAAKEILVPLQCEFFALEGIVKLLQTYEQVKKRLNPQLGLLGVVLTMFDGRNRLTRQVQDEVNRCFPDQIFKTVIPRTVRLSEAPSFGKSILHYDIKSKGSEAYLSLAKEIVMRKPGSRTAKAE